MLEASLGIFKALGWVAFWFCVGAFTLQGFGIGRLMDLGTGHLLFTFLGLIIGAVVGFVVASWVFGVMHLLISMHESLEKLVEVQKALLNLTKISGTTHSHIEAARQSSGNSCVAQPSFSPERSGRAKDTNGGYDNLSDDDLRREIERFGYDMTSAGNVKLVEKDGRTRYLYTRGDVIALVLELNEGRQ